MITHLILDSGPIIKQTPLTGTSEFYYTIPEVLKEIKDENSKLYLESLPFTILTKQPSKEAMNKSNRMNYEMILNFIVLEFSKLTGDVASLSITDIKVLALTLTLEMETHGKDLARLNFVPNEPSKQVGKSNKKVTESLANLSLNSVDQKDSNDVQDSVEEKNEENNEIQDTKEDKDDDKGWITPQNLKEKRNQDLFLSNEPQIIPVACMTTDFAMQVNFHSFLKSIISNSLKIEHSFTNENETYFIRRISY